MLKIIKYIRMAIVLLKYFYYSCYVAILRINRSEEWLIAERGDDARDNSLHMFNYINKKYPEQVIHYVIKKDSADYSKISKAGNTVNYGSKQHYILMLTAGVLISTHIMGFTPDMSLFWRLDKHRLFKARGKRVFLQHGITKDFIPIMSAETTRIDLFICGAKPEYDFIKEKYGHPDGAVKYTGFPRYDELTSVPSRQILLMPTFRRWLNYVDDFTKTEYYKLYYDLINSKRLNDLLGEHDYNLVFYPHYEIQKHLSKFQSKGGSESGRIVLADFENYDVQDLLKRSELLITDYSSVFFDFAYMRKPVVFYQFDEEKYRKSHYESGYFDYRRDAFGPILSTHEEVVDYIEKRFQEGMGVEPMYELRRNTFFPESDQNNCERVYKEIISLSKTC